MKTNIIQVDLRQLNNRELYATYRFLDAEAAQKEYEIRGFDFSFPFLQGNPDHYGKYPTLDEYLATFDSKVEAQESKPFERNGDC